MAISGTYAALLVCALLASNMYWRKEKASLNQPNHRLSHEKVHSSREMPERRFKGKREIR
jgi:hypothetical protein